MWKSLVIPIMTVILNIFSGRFSFCFFVIFFLIISIFSPTSIIAVSNVDRKSIWFPIGKFSVEISFNESYLFSSSFILPFKPSKLFVDTFTCVADFFFFFFFFFFLCFCVHHVSKANSFFPMSLSYVFWGFSVEYWTIK